MEIEIVPVADAHPKGIGLPTLILTLLGTRLGGGMVGIPVSTKNTGYAAIVIFQGVYIWVSMFCIWMLMRTREITGRASYPSLGMHLIGNWSLYCINTIIAFAQLGFPIIFFIVFGDVAKSLILRIDKDAPSFWYSRWITHTFLAIVMFYLVLKKDVQQLKYASVFLFFGI
jgi:amino acid permease